MAINITENLVDTFISPADETALGTAFGTIATILNPYFVSLSEEQRASLFSLKEENRVFASLALEQAQTRPNLIPARLSSLATNMEKDLTLFDQLVSIENTILNQLTLKISDTRRKAAHEAYEASIVLYRVIEALANSGDNEAQAAFDILKPRFASQGRPDETPPTPPTP